MDYTYLKMYDNNFYIITSFPITYCDICNKREYDNYCSDPNCLKKIKYKPINYDNTNDNINNYIRVLHKDFSENITNIEYKLVELEYSMRKIKEFVESQIRNTDNNYKNVSIYRD